MMFNKSKPNEKPSHAHLDGNRLIRVVGCLCGLWVIKKEHSGRSVISSLLQEQDMNFSNTHCQPDHSQKLCSSSNAITIKLLLEYVNRNVRHLFSDMLSCGLLINLSWIFNDFSLRRRISNLAVACARDQLGLGDSQQSPQLYLRIWSSQVLKSKMSRYVLKPWEAWLTKNHFN